MSLTPEQKKILHYCIDQAEGMGFCKYTDNEAEKPMCVIGHLLYLSGWHPEQLAYIDAGNVTKPSMWGNEPQEVKGIASLAENGIVEASDVSDIPILLLNKLQRAWDCGALPELARREMHRLVDSWEGA